MTNDSIRNLKVWIIATTTVAIAFCFVMLIPWWFKNDPLPEPDLTSTLQPTDEPSPARDELLPDGALARLGNGVLITSDLAPSGDFILVGTSIGIATYDTRTFDRTWNQLMPGRVANVAISPDGNFVAGSVAGAVTVFDTSTHEVAAVLHHDSEVSKLAFSPGNNHLAALSAGIVYVWNVASNDQTEVIRRSSSTIDVEWSPDGRYLALASDGVLVRDSITGAEIRFVEQPEKGVGRLAWSDDGNWLVAGLADGTAIMWNLMTLQAVVTQGSHALYVNTIDVSPDLTLMATGADDGQVLVWDLRSGQQVFVLEGGGPIGSPAASILDVEFSGGGTRLMSSARDGSITEWDIGSGQPIRTLNGFVRAIKSLAWSPNGQYLATGGLDGIVHVWDVQSLTETFNARIGRDVVRRLAWSPDGTYLAAVSGENVTVWDAATGEVFQQLDYTGEGDDSAVMPTGENTGTASHVFWDASFSPDGGVLAAGDADGRVIVWRVDTGEQLYSMSGHAHIVNYVHFMQDGTLVSASQDGTLITWNLETGDPADSVLFPGAATLVISPDEQFMAIGRSDARLTIREEGALVSAAVLDNSSDLMIRPTFSNNSALCSAGLNGDMTTVGVFDPSTGELLRSYSGHIQTVLDTALSPDGSLLATASEDGSVLLWSVSTPSDF